MVNSQISKVQSQLTTASLVLTEITIQTLVMVCHTLHQPVANHAMLYMFAPLQMSMINQAQVLHLVILKIVKIMKFVHKELQCPITVHQVQFFYHKVEQLALLIQLRVQLAQLTTIVHTGE